MSDDDIETVSGEVDGALPPAMTPRESVLFAAESLRQANQELNRDPGERPPVAVHQATIAGIAYGLTATADRIADDEGLRSAVNKALDICAQEGHAMGARLSEISLVLRRAASR